MLDLVTKLLKAWRTLESADWSRFADCWLRTTQFAARSANRWIIAGHALRAAERLDEARDAFARASVLRPQGAAALLGLGKTLKAQGDRPAAINAFAAAYWLGAKKKAARQLCRYGARDQVPVLRQGVFPLRSYADFVRQHPVAPPPPIGQEAPELHIWIDGRGCSMDDLARTTRSLIAQSYSNWTAHIATDSAFLEADVDSRLHFVENALELNTACGSNWAIRLPAGSILDPQALSWFAWTITNVNCDSIFADHDHYRSDGSALDRCLPVLHPMHDPIWFADPSNRPMLLVTRSTKTGEAEESPHGRNSHIPRILASLPITAKPQRRLKAAPLGTGRIAVIIPTRDNPELLERCVKTLLETAAQPERLVLNIVDNGSALPKTRALFTRLCAHPLITLMPFDEPFNWSRANNLGAEATDTQHLLFLNDDTQMLTAQWDAILSGLLEEESSVGIIGARLLYPDRSVQHAGFIFGMDNGPQHEGRWMAESDPGPAGRWISPRCAAAVTGAFMAMRRSLFEEIGPFDEEHLAVDFSDVDMCLRARTAGYQVIYAPQIEMIHHESVSRGYNRSRLKRARARREFAAVRAKWGTLLDMDPGYNPHWTRLGCSFDGYSEPSQDQVIAHAQRSAQRNPWGSR